MYTNIPLTEASSSVGDAVPPTGRGVRRGNRYFKSELILQLLELTLQNNFFQFNGKFYHQTLGIAMGTPSECTVSDIFIGAFVKKAFSSCQLLPSLYRQYRDDGLGVWTHGETALQSFLAHLNTLHPTIKFTINYGRSVDYLDSRISIDPFGRLKSETYFKDTETFEFLHPSSDHPSHCKINIALSQNIRHLRLNSSPRTYLYHSKLLRYNLLKRGYDAKTIARKMSIYNFQHRSQLLQYKKKNNTLKRVPLVLPYSSLLPNLTQCSKAN